MVSKRDIASRASGEAMRASSVLVLALLAFAGLATANHDLLGPRMSGGIEEIVSGARFDPIYAYETFRGHLVAVRATGEACVIRTDVPLRVHLTDLIPSEYYQVEVAHAVEGATGTVPIYTPGSPMGVFFVNESRAIEFDLDPSMIPAPSPFEGDLSIIQSPSHLHVRASIVDDADPVVNGIAFARTPQDAFARC